MKKILSLVLAMLMIFSMVPAVFAADTAAEDAHQEALAYLSDIGLYKGGVDASEKLTRWQMALFVSRFITGKTDDAYWVTTENDSGFTDVAEFLDKDMKYVLGAVSFAAQQGIINGYGDGRFGPNDGITYRDALVMVVRALGTTYDAKGYPWSYVNKATEWGLTEGLDSVGHLDQLTRAQVAQILYNAVDVEIDGKTVAESVFGVAEDVIIVTASNDVYLNEGDELVLRQGFVQFAVADGEGKPSGTKYHIDAKELGITDANGAVGDAFKVTHKDNFVKILSYEDLKTEYVNNGEENQIAVVAEKTSSATITISGDAIVTTSTVTLDGVKAYAVSKYTYLLNEQGVDQKTALPETKLYADTSYAGHKQYASYANYYFAGAENLGGRGDQYYMDDKGYIYDSTSMTLVAYYNEYFGGKIYAASAHPATGHITFGTINSALEALIINDLLLGRGQYSLTTKAYDSAYAKAEAFDLNADGVYDRVNLRNYQLGKIKIGDKNNDKKAYNFQLWTGAFWPTTYYGDINSVVNPATGLNDVNVWKSVTTSLNGGKFYTSNHSTAKAANYDYRFTGIPMSEFAYYEEYYVLYYVDVYNYEIDILEVIGQPNKPNYEEGKDTYVARGYVLGLQQTNNLVYINDGSGKIKNLTLGYKDLLGAPIIEFQTDLRYQAYLDYNDALNTLVLDARNYGVNPDYIEYVVVDGKVVYFDLASEANQNNDVVVIDYFTSISEEGVEAMAWSTATNSYENIKIAEFEGWNVAGFNWKDYYFSFMVSGQTPNIAALIPVQAGEIYRVVYNNGNEYNLAAAPYLADQTIDVQKGYISDITGYPTTPATVVAATTDADYWIIREVVKDVDDEVVEVTKVITRSGKMGNVTLAGVEVYKLDGQDHDYVISGTAAELADLYKAIQLQGDTKFVYYNKLSGYADADYKYDNGGFYWGYQMREVFTNEPVFVKYDTDDVEAIKRAVAANGNGAIYMILDDVLYLENVVAATPLTLKDVKNSYVEAELYKAVDAAAFAADGGELVFPAFDAETVVSAARDAVEWAMGYRYWDDDVADAAGATVSYTDYTDVTVIGRVPVINDDGTVQYKYARYVAAETDKYEDEATFYKAVNTGKTSVIVGNAMQVALQVTLYPMYDADTKEIIVFVEYKLPLAATVSVDVIPVGNEGSGYSGSTEYNNTTKVESLADITNNWAAYKALLPTYSADNQARWAKFANIANYTVTCDYDADTKVLKVSINPGDYGSRVGLLVVADAAGNEITGFTNNIEYTTPNTNSGKIFGKGDGRVQTLELTFPNVDEPQDLTIYVASRGSSLRRTIKVTVDFNND